RARSGADVGGLEELGLERPKLQEVRFTVGDGPPEHKRRHVVPLPRGVEGQGRAEAHADEGDLRPAASMPDLVRGRVHVGDPTTQAAPVEVPGGVAGAEPVEAEHGEAGAGEAYGELDEGPMGPHVLLPD